MSKRHDRSASDWKREAERLRDYEDAVLACRPGSLPIELLNVRGAIEYAAATHLKRGEGVGGGGGKKSSKPPTGDPRFARLLDESDRELRKHAKKLTSQLEELVPVVEDPAPNGPGVRR